MPLCLCTRHISEYQFRAILKFNFVIDQKLMNVIAELSRSEQNDYEIIVNATISKQDFSLASSLELKKGR